MTEEEIKTTIGPIVYEVYGKGSFIGSMIDNLARFIDQYGEDEENSPRENEENFAQDLMNKIWLWMPGGGTAEIVTKRILEALDA